MTGSFPNVVPPAALRALVLSAAVVGLLPVRVVALEITSPIVIPLQYTPISSGGYKWGIYATLAGGDTPQLFEFDTGGAGFYSAFSSNASVAPWWGTNFTVVNTNASLSYDSGYSYSGNTVQTSVTLYASSHGPAAMTLSGATVGQTVSIIDTNHHNEPIWNQNGSQVGAPPIDGAFYGDFGMNLGYNSNGIVNLVAQMTFAAGMTPGFIVNTPLDGSNGYVQIGLTASQTNRAGFNYFGMNVLSNGQTTASGTPYYNLMSVNLNLGISNSLTGSNYTTNIGIVTDTGATPNIHNTQIASNPPFPADWVTTDPDGKQFLSNGLTLTLSGTNTEGENVTVYTITSAKGDDYRNSVGSVIVQDANTRQPEFDFNAGLYFFDKQQVSYDLSNGLVGLGALSVPEPATSFFFGLGFSVLLLVMLRRRNAD